MLLGSIELLMNADHVLYDLRYRQGFLFWIRIARGCRGQHHRVSRIDKAPKCPLKKPPNLSVYSQLDFLGSRNQCVTLSIRNDE